MPSILDSPLGVIDAALLNDALLFIDGLFMLPVVVCLVLKLCKFCEII
jgi:hypothetical protein